MSSKFFEIDCGDDEPVVLEIVKPAKMVTADNWRTHCWKPAQLRWHNWDLDTELAAQELGFPPSRCYVVHLILNHPDFDPTKQMLKAVIPASEYVLRKSIPMNFPGWIDILLAAGADPDALTSDEEPVLAVAAMFGEIEAVEALVAGGADVAAGHNSAVRWAAAVGNYNIVRMLVEAGADPQLGLYDAVAVGNFQIIELLLESGADVDDYALKVAMDYGHPDVVDALEERRRR